jgi:hypothetical protein
MAIFAAAGPIGLGVLASLFASPPVEQARFEPRPDDPRAADYRPRNPLELRDYAVTLTVSNHLVRVFGLERPHAYGLDAQLGLSLLFEGEPVSFAVRPETGYAFVHHVDFNSHASITGLGMCLLPREPLSVCYTPSFVAGSEAKQLLLGVRHGLAVGLAFDHIRYNANVVTLEAQHGVSWVGAAGPRHELRGVLSVNVIELTSILMDYIMLAVMT